MNHALNLRNALLLTIPPLMWAGNAVAGRLLSPLVPPITLNFLRWLFACAILLPLASWILRPGNGVWIRWRRYAVLGLLSVGLYNALQYLALQTSTPMNVTLVASSMPVFTLALGALFFGQRIQSRQVVGALLSISGVLLVLAHGDFRRLAQVQFVPGDLYIILATLAWALYSWLLSSNGKDDPKLRADWAGFLLAQMLPGLAWSGLFAAGEWLWTDPVPIQWGWPLAGGLIFIAIGPALIAYRCWGLGVQRLGPNVAGIFNNLTPLFAALLSAALLGEVPQWHHAVAFALLVVGIFVGSRRPA